MNEKHVRKGNSFDESELLYLADHINIRDTQLCERTMERWAPSALPLISQVYYTYRENAKPKNWVCTPEESVF